MQNKVNLFHYENIFKKKNLSIDDLKNIKKNQGISNSHNVNKKTNDKSIYDTSNNNAQKDKVEDVAADLINGTRVHELNGQLENSRLIENQNVSDIHRNDVTNNTIVNNGVGNDLFEGYKKNEEKYEKVPTEKLNTFCWKEHNAVENNIIGNNVVENNIVGNNTFENNIVGNNTFENNIVGTNTFENNTVGNNTFVEENNNYGIEQGNDNLKKDNLNIKSSRFMKKKKNDLSSLFDDTSYVSLIPTKQKENEVFGVNDQFLHLNKQQNEYTQMNETENSGNHHNNVNLNFMNADNVSKVADINQRIGYTTQVPNTMSYDIPMNNVYVQNYVHTDSNTIEQNTHSSNFNSVSIKNTNEYSTGIESERTMSVQQNDSFIERSSSVRDSIKKQKSLNEESNSNADLHIKKQSVSNDFANKTKETQISFFPTDTHSEHFHNEGVETLVTTHVNRTQCIQTDNGKDYQTNNGIIHTNSYEYGKPTDHVVSSNEQTRHVGYEADREIILRENSQIMIQNNNEQQYMEQSYTKPYYYEQNYNQQNYQKECQHEYQQDYQKECQQEYKQDYQKDYQNDYQQEHQIEQQQKFQQHYAENYEQKNINQKLPQMGNITETYIQERTTENENLQHVKEPVKYKSVQSNDAEDINFLKNPQILFEDNAKLEIKDSYIDKMFKEENESNYMLDEEQKKILQSKIQVSVEEKHENRHEQKYADNYETIILTSPDKTYNESAIINTEQIEEKFEKKTGCFCFGNNGLFFYTKNSTLVKGQYLINIVENKITGKEAKREQKETEEVKKIKKNGHIQINEDKYERAKELGKEQTVNDAEEYLYYLKNFPGPFSRKNKKDDERIKNFLIECINRNKAKYEENIFQYTQKNCLYNYLLNLINKPDLLHFNLMNIKTEKNNSTFKKNEKKNLLKRAIPFFTLSTDSEQQSSGEVGNNKNNNDALIFKKSRKKKGKVNRFRINKNEEEKVFDSTTHVYSVTKEIKDEKVVYDLRQEEKGRDKENEKEKEEDEYMKEDETEETEETEENMYEEDSDEITGDEEKEEIEEEEEEENKETEKIEKIEKGIGILQGVHFNVPLEDSEKREENENVVFNKYFKKYYKDINSVSINNWKFDFFDFINEEFIKELHKLENHEKITMEDIYLEYFRLSMCNSKKATELCIQKGLYKYFFLILKKLNKKKYYKMLNTYINHIQSSNVNEIEMKNEIKHIYKIYNYNIYDDVFIESFVFLASILNCKKMKFKKNIVVNYWYAYFTSIFHNFLFQHTENEIDFENYKSPIIHFFVYLINILLKYKKATEAYFLMLLFCNHPFSFEKDNETFIKRKKYRSTLLGENAERAHFDICAFQITEIYEYICRQMNDNFFYEHLVAYKMMYTSILLEWGVLDKAQKYLQMIYYYIDVIKSQNKNSHLTEMYYHLLDRTKYLFPQNQNLLSSQNLINESVYSFKEMISRSPYENNAIISTNTITQTGFYVNPTEKEKVDYCTAHSEGEKGNEIKSCDIPFHNKYKNGIIQTYDEHKNNYQNISTQNEMAGQQHPNVLLRANQNNHMESIDNSIPPSSRKNMVHEKYFPGGVFPPMQNRLGQETQVYFTSPNHVYVNETERNKQPESINGKGENERISSQQSLLHEKKYINERDQWTDNRTIGYEQQQTKSEYSCGIWDNRTDYAENKTNNINIQRENYMYGYTHFKESDHINVASNNNLCNRTAEKEQPNNKNISYNQQLMQHSQNTNTNNLHSTPFVYNNCNYMEKNEHMQNNTNRNEQHRYHRNVEGSEYDETRNVQMGSKSMMGATNLTDSREKNNAGIVDKTGPLQKNVSANNMTNAEVGNTTALNKNEGDPNENNMDIINLGKNIITGFFANLKEKIKKTEEVAEEENLFYYDQEKKRWREKGVTSDEEREREQQKIKREMEIKSIAPPPIPVNYTAEKVTLNKKDVRNRYVDYFN